MTAIFKMARLLNALHTGITIYFHELIQVSKMMNSFQVIRHVPTLIRESIEIPPYGHDTQQDNSWKLCKSCPL